MPGQPISAISEVMAITGRGWPTHLVSRNKHIRLWYWRLAQISKTQIVKASKLAEGIDPCLAQKYNPTKVFIDSVDSEDLGDESQMRPTFGTEHSTLREVVDPESALQIKANDDYDALDKLYTPSIGSKLIQFVWKNKSMIPTTSKLEKMYTNLWDPHDRPSQSGSTYAAIFICEHFQKT